MYFHTRRFGRNANDDEANRRDEVAWVTGQEEGLGTGLRCVWVGGWVGGLVFL